MTNPNYGLLDPNAFQRGYQTGNAIVGGVVDSFQEGEKNNALRAYAANPDAPGAIGNLARYDPRLAITARHDDAARQKEKHDRDTKLIAGLAQNAKTPEAFDAAVDQVVAMGYPEAVQFKGKFSPALRSALMAAGGLKDEGAGDVVVIDGVAFDKATGQPRFESPYPKVVSGPGGIYEQPRIGYGRPGATSAVPQGHAVSGPEIAPGWELVDEPDGGQTPPASGNFPKGVDDWP